MKFNYYVYFDIIYTRFDIYKMNNNKLNEECIDPVTLEIMKDPYVTRCGHSFDFDTLNKLFDKDDITNIVCPICQQQIIFDSMVRNNALRNIIELFKNVSSSEKNIYKVIQLHTKLTSPIHYLFEVYKNHYKDHLIGVFHPNDAILLKIEY